MDFTIPEDLQLLRSTVREYVRDRLQPLAMQIETEGRVPEDVLSEMKELGFFGLPFPEEYGGMGAGELGYCLAMEELGGANAAISNIVGGHSSLSGMAIYLAGSEELKRRYLPSMCTGERVGAFALTEPNAGSDAVHIQVAALRDHDGFRLNGTKLWVTNGPIADLLTVFAVTDREKGTHGITAFVVETDQPGVQVGKIDEKMGLHGSLTSEIIFDGALVPAENLIGEEGRGFRVAMQTLDSARVALGASAVGQAQAMLDRAVSWSKQRIQFGKPLAANQAIQWMLADSEVDIHAGRMMVYNAAWKIDAGQRASHEAAMVKLYCAEMANRVADRCVQVHGGMGYMKELDIERFYRDARILRIYEGTSEVQRMIIAADLLED
ncbi:MAG TPA: acyl-CoA dehydrogenase family protein [Chloroflexota bacterium]|nr:acyl-CoA dehydrogenase family protein [Chloroflexota bacterium]